MTIPKNILANSCSGKTACVDFEGAELGALAGESGRLTSANPVVTFAFSQRAQSHILIRYLATHRRYCLIADCQLFQLTKAGRRGSRSAGRSVTGASVILALPPFRIREGVEENRGITLIRWPRRVVQNFSNAGSAELNGNSRQQEAASRFSSTLLKVAFRRKYSNGTRPPRRLEKNRDIFSSRK